MTLSSESLVITCLLFLKTWNFLMLGAPVYKWKNISLIWRYKVGQIGWPVGCREHLIFSMTQRRDSRAIITSVSNVCQDYDWAKKDSWNLPTLPSPDPTLTLTSYSGQNNLLSWGRGGWAVSPESYTDLSKETGCKLNGQPLLLRRSEQMLQTGLINTDL